MLGPAGRIAMPAPAQRRSSLPFSFQVQQFKYGGAAGYPAALAPIPTPLSQSRRRAVTFDENTSNVCETQAQQVCQLSSRISNSIPNPTQELIDEDSSDQGCAEAGPRTRGSRG